MISGYVSSEEEDSDDEFYSDPMIKGNDSFTMPQIHNKKNLDKLTSAMELENKIGLFFKYIEEDNSGDKIQDLEKLITFGVSVDGVLGSHQWTPLLKACSLGKCDVVQFLLEKNANPNLSIDLFTPLMASCSKSYITEEFKLNCVHQLLRNGAQINAKDKYHTTALMYAAENEYISIINAFLSHPDIDINIQDKEGLSALHYAVINNNEEIVKKLLAAGADLHIKDRNERTAVDIALIKGFKNVAKILGYIEPIETIDQKPLKKTKFLDILSELPLENGEGGFYSDVEPLLQSRMLIPLNKEVSLPQFLNSNESELHKIGVLFQFERLKLIKKTIHKYHLTPWKKSSMPAVASADLDLYTVIDIMSAMLKHLTIINASLNYLKTRIRERCEKFITEDLLIQQKLIQTLLNSHMTAEKLRNNLNIIVKHSYKNIEICTPCDYIEHPSKINEKTATVKKICYIGLTVLSVWLFFRNRFHFLNSKFGF